MTVTRALLREQIRDAILQRILDGTYPPGTRLVEVRLAQEFASSQAPVREALRELEALQYVVSIPNRGTRVREVPPTEMRDAYLVRAALEGAAAEAAARTAASDWRALDGVVREIEDAAARGDVSAYARADEVFHRTLVDRAGNPVLLRHWELLLVATRVLLVLRSGALDLSTFAADHRPILDAVAGGDAPLASRLAYDHARRIADRL